MQKIKTNIVNYIREDWLKNKLTTILRIFLLFAGFVLLVDSSVTLISFNTTLGLIKCSLALGLMAYALLFNLISKYLHIAVWTAIALLCAFFLFLFTYGNINTSDYTEDVIIVLGSGIIDDRVGPTLASRLDTALDNWHNNPDAYIIVTGGLGDRATVTEAEAMSRFLINRGVPAEKILLEDRSTSTYENLTFALEILDYHFPDGFRAVLVTSDFHIYRAAQTARYVGIDTSRVGAATRRRSWPANYTREMLAVSSMWIRGVR